MPVAIRQVKFAPRLGRAGKSGVAWCALGRVAGAEVAGIAVEPHMVLLTARMPAGEITVRNPHATRAEFSVDLRFGFATTDSTGQLRVELNDGIDCASAAGWITPYPSRFTLRPSAKRTVRLLARPPADLADGEYWARITVYARDDAPAAVVDSKDGNSTCVRIAMDTATVLPVFFRKGSVSTGVSISSVEAVTDHNAVEVNATLRRTGNAAFLGVAHITVRDPAGRTIGSIDRHIAVYRSMRPRWKVVIGPGISLNGCSVAIRLSTDRHDVAHDRLLPARPVETIVIPTPQHMA